MYYHPINMKHRLVPVLTCMVVPIMIFVYTSCRHKRVNIYEGERPLVVVKQGSILGITLHWENLDYFAFRTIPYAKPPTGLRRFMEPEAGEAWSGVLDGSKEPNWCPQMVLAGNEDCLYLNVYTPQNALRSPTPYPVMVFIHGGAFFVGSAKWFDSVGPLIRKGVIVVLLQYRLGVLGFFSTDDMIVPGNMGLKDQTMALKWVKNNIHAFGGDTNRITIFGESAGSASVHFQLLTPYSKGLFHGAIMQSGTALSPWATGRLFKYTATELAKRFSCPIESEELVRCLQKVDHRRLDEMYYYFMGWNSQPFYFAPRIDGDFIPDEPATLLKNGNYTNVPVIMGSVKDEGALESAEMYTFPILIKRLQDQFKQNGPISLMLLEDEDPVNTAAKVYSRYLNGVFINDHNADNLTQLYTDRLFLISLDWSAELMAPHGPVYTYELHHKGEYGYTSLMHLLGLRLPQANNWVSHGDDLMYVLDILGQSWLKLNTPEDLAVREIFTTTWTNFARTRIPTPDNRLGVNWTVTGGKEALCHLNILPTPQMKEDQRQTIRKFWESLPLRINKLINGRCIYNGENKSRTNNTDAYISNKLIFDDSIFNLC